MQIIHISSLSVKVICPPIVKYKYLIACNKVLGKKGFKEEWHYHPMLWKV